MQNSKKILIIGHARHGKDTVAENLRHLFGLTFKSSSVAAAEIFLFEALGEKYGYSCFKECFEDRVNHRDEWHDLICEYNKSDKARLAKDILKSSDIYVGMRSDEEVSECIRQGLFGLIIGVFNPDKPLEPESSFNIDIWKCADVIIPNSGSIQDLIDKICLLKGVVLPV